MSSKLLPLSLTLWLSINQLSTFNFHGKWTYSPSLEALSGIKNIRKPGPGEDNMFLVPSRNSFQIGNDTVYHCKICNDYRTVCATDYVKHAKEAHFYPGHEVDHKWVDDLLKHQDYNYSCNVCNETYKTEMALLWHLTKFSHFDDKDLELCKYLQQRLRLNETIGRKVVYHQMFRPFYKEKEPKNCSFGNSAELEQMFRGFEMAKYLPNADLSSGDASNQLMDSDIIKTGFSKYVRSRFEKRVRKINGVNVYQRSPEVKYTSETDESAEEEQRAKEAAERQRKRDEKLAIENQDLEEIIKREDESFPSAVAYRRHPDEYGPWASHTDKVVDKERRKITRKIMITKADPNIKKYPFAID